MKVKTKNMIFVFSNNIVLEIKQKNIMQQNKPGISWWKRIDSTQE